MIPNTLAACDGTLIVTYVGDCSADEAIIEIKSGEDRKQLVVAKSRLEVLA